MADLIVVMSMRIALLLVPLLLAAACGEQPSAQPTTPATPSPAPSAGGAEGVSVTLTGTPVITDDGVEWCPAGTVDTNCAGVPVTGVPEDAIEAFAQSPMWQIDGVYDGVTMQATGAPEPVEDTEPTFTTPCEDLRGKSPGSSGMSGPSGAVEGYVATIPERYAATWWDQENAVVNVLLTGDDIAEHRAALEEAAGDRVAVCVIGGARWSAADLDRAQQRAFDIANEAGMEPWSASVNAVANRVELDVERSDQATVARIEREAGEAVHVRSFLAVRDTNLNALPEPPSRGDVELETAQRGGVGMLALGFFTLRFDEQNGCVYGEAGQKRIGLVWPFGYYAESGPPLRVYNQRGELVAQEGAQLESGGGEAHRDSCGATDVWVMNGRPKVVGSSEG